MKRRDFLKTSAAAAGLLGPLDITRALAVVQGDPQHASEQNGSPVTDNRPPEYLHRVQGDRFLPRQPAPVRSYRISPMPLAERVRRGLVPKRGFCSIAPANLVGEALISGNGAMNVELNGDPHSEQILFHHESLLMPWRRPLEAPNAADIFPLMRQMVLNGKTREATALAIEHMNKGPIKQDTEPHPTVPAFLMQFDLPNTASVKDYLRTVDFESGEVNVYWSDERGDWVRQTFTSRPDNVVVQWLTAPAGQSVDVRISLRKSAEWSMSSGMDWGSHPGIGATAAALTPKGAEAHDVRLDCNEQRLIYKCILDPAVDNSGYAGVVRIVRNGGSALMDRDTLVIEGAASVMLLTRIEYFPEYSEDQVEALRKAVEEVPAAYPVLLERHRKIQSEMLNRVTADFGGASQYGMSSEELLTNQRSRPDYSPALLERVFEMGRYWFISTSGKYPSIAAEINSTINLQTAGAVQGGLREGMEAYFNWVESLAPDCRVNARNIFGCRGTLYPVFPDKGIGVNFYYTSSSDIGVWPYWISAGGWACRQFWDHYLVTGDEDFLRNRVVPAYKELALFYEDFLTLTDWDGNYMFVPSISPENLPRRTDATAPELINATMDISVCREVLTNLIQASETLGSDADRVPKWKAMLGKMPPYVLELDGTLKEWAWPTLEEHYSHRHVSHLYGVWPGDEIDPDRTPQLARAAEIADRRRTFDTLPTAVAGETLPAYARCHRALVGARLKDNVIVDVQLRQLLEQGYISTAFRCSREPYGRPVPDGHGGIPALLMEMLLYSRPGLIEVLPALPETLAKGSISGMLARCCARINTLAWDMDARTVNLTVTSYRDQDITLMARQGIEEISAPAGVLGARLNHGAANCDLHLPEGKPVDIHMKLGAHKPLEWASRAML
ncbi:MAG TPA: glycoside hydrolase N-terminal domain-containing protein [Terracidiphilus sp.]|nr:glycoside hydrolase N-terminal domain-containing protein [Terracidiphilus sp.]